MKKIFCISCLALGLSACNDSFMEREPVDSLVESNAFKTYDNFRAYMYKCYGLFTDARIMTNQSGTQYNQNGQYWSDLYSGLLTDRDLRQNPYAYQAVNTVTASNNWDFSSIRAINIMLSHLNDGALTEAQRKHWRSVGYFFHSWWYMELVARYGDIPYITKVLTDESPEAYGPRTPRAEVAQHIVERLEYAIENIGDCSADGDNAVNADVCRAALSRFLLREATWAKYHGLDEDYETYLKKCLAVSEQLMEAYPTLYTGNGNDHYPAAGFDNEYTTESLKGVPGIIFYKEYVDGVLTHRFSDFVHVAAHTTDAPQATIDLYLMQNGRPIANAASGYKGGEGKDLWDVFEGRDPRLPITFEPPVQAKIGKFADPDNVTTFAQWTFWGAGEKLNGKSYVITKEDSVKFRRYIDYFGPNIMCYDGGGVPSLGSKRLPAHNHTNSMSHSAPNITKHSQTDNYMRCLTGYYFWKSYTSWEKGLNKAYQTSDKPIFLLSEVLLNYAEAACELGLFTQEVADKTINKLRERSGVAPMMVSLIDENWDPKRDRGTAAWTQEGYDSLTNYPVNPLLWEIRRERLVELMGTGMSFYDVKRWHKAPYFINRQPCGAWVTATNLPYGTGAYTGNFVDNNLIEQTGSADPNTSGSGWIYTYPGPLASGKGWLDKYYLEQIPLDQITLNPKLEQNPGYENN